MSMLTTAMTNKYPGCSSWSVPNTRTVGVVSGVRAVGGPKHTTATTHRLTQGGLFGLPVS